MRLEASLRISALLWTGQVSSSASVSDDTTVYDKISLTVIFERNSFFAVLSFGTLQWNTIKNTFSDG